MNQARPLTILHLYPRDMNIYGDNGNIQVLKKRIEWHGYAPIIIEYNPEDTFPDLNTIDIIIGGGGQDSGQSKIYEDLLENSAALHKASTAGTPMLMICGLYQLFGNEFITHTGESLKGIGIFNLKTIGGKERLVGNITTQSNLFGTVIGYENHSGQTYLEQSTEPLGEVLLGAGNNMRDGHEGAITHNTIGTYLHGPLLPKNPVIADYLIGTAAERRYGTFEGRAIDDSVALRARESARQRPR